VEVVKADEAVCVAMVEPQVNMQGGMMECLTRQDLMDNDFMSMGKDGFVPINVKPMINTTRLNDDML
jgi:hypothetical protein